MNKFLQHPNYVCKPSKTMHLTSSQRLKLYERSSPRSTNRLNTKTHLKMNSTPLSERISPCLINTMHLNTSQPIMELDIHEHHLTQNTKKKTLLERLQPGGQETNPLLNRGLRRSEPLMNCSSPGSWMTLLKRFSSPQAKNS